MAAPPAWQHLRRGLLTFFPQPSHTQQANRSELAARDLLALKPGGTQVINRIFSGSRCRITRSVPHPGGVIDRHTHGTIRYGMENLGRELLMVDWDSGKATLVFPDDIELITIESFEAPVEALDTE